jgi:hypothetical protein
MEKLNGQRIPGRFTAVFHQHPLQACSSTVNPAFNWQIKNFFISAMLKISNSNHEEESCTSFKKKN